MIVAEDESLIRLFAVEFLQDAGFEVIEARHADQALTILADRADGIHLLFTDIHMPGAMNGLQLAHHSRMNWPWVSLLLASGHARPVATDLPHGSRFMAKPYDPDHMLAHVREMTDVLIAHA